MKKYTHKSRNTVLALLLALSTLPASGQQELSQLPDMGDSSSTTLSLEEEMMIGREVKKQRYNSVIINDPIVTEYIERLGRSLSSAAVTNRNHFQFFVTNEPGINAFALPGGYIGIHARTILASETESELAAVLAHEIAHVTQRHIARFYERLNQTNLPMTAAMIAAILLSGGDPQVASAAIHANYAGRAQMAVDTTRTNEKEADRVGIQLLAFSDFDPRGMSNFFGRLQHDQRYEGSSVPEFLRTHPVTSRRLSEAEDRARQYPLQLKGSSIHYHLVKARLQVMLSDNPDKALDELSTLRAKSVQQDEALHYQQALLMRKAGDTSGARKVLSTLLQQHPERIAYIYELAQLEDADGHFSRAAELYRQGFKQYPGNDLLTLAYSDLLIDNTQFDKARTLLETQLRDDSTNAEAYHLLAELEAKSGNKAASHLAQAEYYYLQGEPHSAMDQLNTAKRIKSLPHYFLSRIEARLEQIQDELERYNGEKVR